MYDFDESAALDDYWVVLAESWALADEIPWWYLG